MSRKPIFSLCMILVVAGCQFKHPESNRASALPVERHLKHVTQLTFDGDNGEAYFSGDGEKLIWQSNRGGYSCDKIWTMNIDGSDKHMVSPDHGAHTCSFFFPGSSRRLCQPGS